MKYLLSFIFLFILGHSNAQILNDNQAKQTLVFGLDHLYNFEFDKAKPFFDEIKTRFPGHPVLYLLSGLQLNLENIPLEHNPKAIVNYLAEQKKCHEAAKILYKNPKYKKEAIFFLLASQGFIALTKNYQNKQLDAVVEAKSAYSYYKEGKNLKSEIPEFYFSSGLYNYYVVQYPANHPIIKPMMWFFEGGSKKLGLQELELAAKNSIFTKVEASTHLISVLLKYESNFKKALTFATILNQKYPRNYTFNITYAECLLLNNEFLKAETVVNSFQNQKSTVSDIAELVFKGYIAEKHYKKPVDAITYYSRALKLKGDLRFTKDYQAMAYAGMGRYFYDQKNNAKAKIMFKQSLELAESNWIITESKSYLSKL